MMRNRKVAKIVMLCMALIMALAVPVSAKEKASNVDRQLMEQGVPSELIQMMPEEQKNDILRNGGKFQGYEKTTLKEHGSSISDEGVIMPSFTGTISSTDMDLYISKYELYPYNSTDKKMRVYVNYEWKKMPFITLTDAYGVSWDPSLWMPEDNSSISYTYWKLESGSIKSESDTAMAFSGESGIGWTTDIKGVYGLSFVADNYGYSAVTLVSKDPTKSGTSQFHTNYAHIAGAGSIGLSFSVVSVSYSGSADAYTRGTYLTYSY